MSRKNHIMVSIDAKHEVLPQLTGAQLGQPVQVWMPLRAAIGVMGPTKQDLQTEVCTKYNCQAYIREKQRAIVKCTKSCYKDKKGTLFFMAVVDRIRSNEFNTLAQNVHTKHLVKIMKSGRLIQLGRLWTPSLETFKSKLDMYPPETTQVC